MSQVFNIVINYFKPENINIDGYKPKEQREIILELVNRKPEKDAKLEDYLKQMSDLEEQGDDTEKNLQTSKQTYSTFLEDVERIQEHEKNNKKPIMAGHETQYIEINEVVFQFEVKEEEEKDNKISDNEQEEHEKKPKQILTWTIYDPVAKHTQTGEAKMQDMSQLAGGKNTVISTYMQQRPGLIMARQANLDSGVKSLDRRLRGIDDDKYTTKSYKQQYEDFKAMMENINASKRKDKITQMRDSFKSKYNQHDVSKSFR